MYIRSNAGGVVEIGDERAKALLATGSWYPLDKAETAVEDSEVTPEGDETPEPAEEPEELPEAQEEASTETARPDVATVRAWAKENNVEVSDKGRVSGAVYDQYADAHNI